VCYTEHACVCSRTDMRAHGRFCGTL
jgi:hypothetical protein